MSEPYSAIAQVTIERAALISYLDDAPSPASAWDDWRRTGGEWYDFSWDRDFPGYLARVDARLAGTNRHVIRHLIEPDILPGTQRCAYDAPTRRFTFATLMLADNLEDVVLFLAAARGLARYMHGGDSGFALVQDYLWGSPPETLAAIAIEARRSAFLDPQRDAAAHERNARAAIAIFDDIKDAAGAPGRVIDQLDEIR
jgi:hypothetical protein